MKKKEAEKRCERKSGKETRTKKRMTEGMKMNVEKQKTEIKPDELRQWGFVNCFCIQPVEGKQKKSRSVKVKTERERILEKCRRIIAEYEKRIAAEKRR